MSGRQRAREEVDTNALPNLGYLFNRNFYSIDGVYKSSLKAKQIEKKLEDITSLKTRQLKQLLPMAQDLQQGLGDTGFYMKTRYPGLLVGLGYAHGQALQPGGGNDDGSKADVKTGCSFDYTLGLPVIPGSSLKGMLHNCFRDGREKVVRHLLKKESLLGREVSLQLINQLRISIFEGDEETHMDQRDIFYDALPVEAEKRLMGEDYITPHNKGDLKNPLPIKMLRVEPGVTFHFRFKLQKAVCEYKPSKESDEVETMELSAAKKRELFIQLIELWGIGAKTRVGYGNVRALRDIEHEQRG